MASEKISAMPSAATLDGTELVPLVQGGVNCQCTVDTLLARLLRNLSAGQIAYFDGSALNGDAGIVRVSAGHLNASLLSFTTELVAGTFGLIIDSGGNVLCETVQPNGAFSGLGTFTAWSIADGIVMSAS